MRLSSRPSPTALVVGALAHMTAALDIDMPLALVRHAPATVRNPTRNIRNTGHYIPGGVHRNCGHRGISPKSVERAQRQQIAGLLNLMAAE